MADVGGAPASFIDSMVSRLRAGFNNLPYIIICLVGLLAMGLGSIGLFVLFVGHAAIVPILVNILQQITGAIELVTRTSLFSVDGAAADANVVIPGSESSPNVGPSYWSAHMSFFFGYLLANGISLNTAPADPLIDKIHVNNRKMRSRNIIVATILFALIVPMLRFRLTGGDLIAQAGPGRTWLVWLISIFTLNFQGGAETMAGILLALIACGGIGYAWYLFAESCGARAADVFGIAHQIIPASSKNETPMACVYSPKP